jgi:hypothetical protein
MANIKLSDVITKFTGEGDVCLWYEKLELVMTLKEIPDPAKFVPLFLEGPAFDVYQQLTPDQKSKGDDIKARLVATFGKSAYQAYTAFKNRSLGQGESPDVYLAELRRLATIIGYKGEGAEPLLCCQFIDGLPERVKGHVKALKGVDEVKLDSLLQCTKGYLQEERPFAGFAAVSNRGTFQDEHPFAGFAAVGNRGGSPQERGRYGPPRTSGGNQPVVARCHGCGRTGHFQKDCSVECFTCGKRGHVRARCQTNVTSSGNQSGNWNGEGNRAPASSPANKN